MLRNTLIAAFVFCQAIAYGQQKETAARIPVEKINYEAMGSPMPAMLLLTIDTVAEGKAKGKKHKQKDDFTISPYNTKMYDDQHFNNNANLIVMMFNPTCGHCEDQTERFIKDIALFKKSKLVLMANLGMKSYLPKFATDHHIAQYPNVMTLGVDSTDFIKNVFLYQALPQINIYSADRKLLKTYTGTVPMDSLAQYIQ
jgi:thiol-disulfide isomerase/thioredoxin